MFKIVCNRCGAEIKDHRSVGYVAIGVRDAMVPAPENEELICGGGAF